MTNKEKTTSSNKPKTTTVQPKTNKTKSVSSARLASKLKKDTNQVKKTKKIDMHSVLVICNCGNKFKTLSTSKDNLKVEICSACHPLYTGTQKLVDTTGQVEKYKERLAKMAALKKQRSKKH